MFDLFRSRAKAVRYLLGGMLMLVAISMVVTLIPGWGSSTGDRQDTTIAKIGKDTITSREVQQQVQAALRNKAFPRDMAATLIPRYVDQMIDERVIAYEAERLGMTVSEAELARAIRASLPQLFQNGQFAGRDVYAAFLAEQNMTIPEFEENFRKQLLLVRVQNLVADGVVVTPIEIAALYQHRNEKVKLSYIALTPAKYRSEVSASAEEIRTYYDTNKSMFRVPAKRSFDLLVVDAAKVAARLNVPEETLRKVYDTNKEQFRVPERVHVRHILLKTTDKPKEELPKIQARAEDLLKQIKGGADFAEIAKKQSEDPGSAVKGGDLDWIARGQTVPAFESAAFSLKPKETSNVIKTEYGFHIIQVLEKQDARLKPFEEVKDQLAAERKKQQVFDIMQKLADQAHDEVARTPQDAGQVAKRLDVDINHFEKVGLGEPVAPFGVNAEFQEAVQQLQKGGVTGVMQAPGDKLAFAVVTAVIPEHPAEINDVESALRDRIIAGKLAKLVDQRGQEALEKVKAAGGDLKKAAQQMGLEVKTTQEFTRDGAADGIGPAIQVIKGFEQPVGSVFGPVSVGDQRFICKIDSRTMPEPSTLAEQRESLASAIKTRKGRERYELFQDSVRDKLVRDGKVKVYPDNVKRLIASFS
jgi:peptidyl-prolyl cis-trans isomerase D